MGVMLGVACFVEESMPVVRPSDRLDDEKDSSGNLDRRAEGPRRFLRPRLEVELDVPLRTEVDSEARECRLERRKHRGGGESLVPAGCPEQARDVPALRVIERDPNAVSEQ